MTMLKQGTGRALTLLLAGAVLASCTAHGRVRDIDLQTHRNYTPYDKAFYETLLSGRAWVFEGKDLRERRNVVHGFVFTPEGKLLECGARIGSKGQPLWTPWRTALWKVDDKFAAVGAVVTRGWEGERPRFLALFYDPATGELANEIRVRNSTSNKRYWIRSTTGQLQDSWPRALADACPSIKPPKTMEINERQTSLRMDELRRQDPDAPVRNFPGSHMTAPGRTGLGASRGAPTTTAEEVEAYLAAQEGNILKSPQGNGFAYVKSEGREELWALGADGAEEEFVVPVRSSDGTRVTAKLGGRDVVYVVGYPFPFAPTGHRHPAWQLTDELIGGGEPVPLPWLGKRYSGYRFLFHDKTLTIVGPGDRYLTGRWAWTKGRLEVSVDGDEGNARSIAWGDLARELGVAPRVWTRSTPNRG